MEQSWKPIDNQPLPFNPISGSDTTVSNDAVQLVPTANGLVLSPTSPSPESPTSEAASDVSVISMPAVANTVSADAESDQTNESESATSALSGEVVRAMWQPKVEDLTDNANTVGGLGTVIDVTGNGDTQAEAATNGDEAGPIKREAGADWIEDHADHEFSEMKKSTDVGQESSRDTTSIGDTVRDSLKKFRGWLANIHSQIEWDCHTTRLADYNTAIRDTCTSALRSAYISPCELLGGAMYGAGVAVYLASQLTSTIGMITAGALVDGRNWLRGKKVTISSTEPNPTQVSSSEEPHHLEDSTTVPISAVIVQPVTPTVVEGDGMVPGGLKPSEWRSEAGQTAETTNGRTSETTETNMKSERTVLA